MRQGESSGLDWRTLLAFAIMILAWVVFSQFFMPHPAPAPSSPDAATVAGSETADSAEVARAPADDSRSRSRARTADDEPPHGFSEDASAWVLENELPAAARTITVDGPLHRAEFGTRGAVLRSWALQSYSDPAGKPADLIAAGDSSALALWIEGPTGVLDLSATVFALEEADPPTLEAAAPGGAATGDGARVLRFVAEGTPRRRAQAGGWAAAESAESPSGAAAPPRLRVERTYRIHPSRYDFEMEVVVRGISNPRRDHRLGIAWDEGIPFLEKHAGLERQVKGAVGLLAEEFVKVDFGGGGSFGCGCGGGQASRGGTRTHEGMLRWAGVRTKYFTGLLVPQEEEEATFLTLAEPRTGRVGMRLLYPLADDGATLQRFAVYAGPVDYWILKEFDRRQDRQITRMVNFGGKLIAPISKASLWFLVQVHAVVPNYGVAIIVLALALRVLFHPLTIRSLRAQRRMQVLKPELEALNEQYKDKPELRAKKTMEFYTKHGASPLSGCLPLLVQMPAIYALYGVLMNAIELRKAPFAFWMQDLAAPDRVGEVFGIPIHILPVLMALTMFWQQKMTPTDPRQAPLLLMMPILMVFIFYSLPSGLVLYWTVTNLLTMAQQMAMKPEELLRTDPAAEELPVGRKSPKGAKRK